MAGFDKQEDAAKLNLPVTYRNILETMVQNITLNYRCLLLKQSP